MSKNKPRDGAERLTMTTVTKTEEEKAEMRVLIAKDVIKQVQGPLLVPCGGGYCTLIERYDEDMEAEPLLLDAEQSGSDLRDLIGSKVKACEVCAKGALFVAHVLRHDGVKLPEVMTPIEAYFGHDACVNPLREYFSDEQLDLIEAAFEGDDISGSLNEELTDAAQLFYDRVGSSGSKCLTAIMENIIENGGTFKPDRL